MKNPMAMAIGVTVLAVMGLGAGSLASRVSQGADSAVKGQAAQAPIAKDEGAFAVPASLDWQAFDKGLEQAKEHKKYILVQFFATWCGYCRKMDHEVFTDPSVKAALAKDFVPVRVTESSEHQIKYENQTITEKQLTQMNQVTGFPTLVFMDSDGKPLGKIPGFIAAKDMKGILQFISTASYKKMNFQTFKEKVLKS